MLRISKIFLFVTLAVIAIWQLPWCYAFITTQSSPNQFVMYSSLLDDFIISGFEEGKGITRHDLSGNLYTEQEVDSLLPVFYMRQLVADERFPDTLLGVPVSPKEIQQTTFNFRMRPSAINTPQIGIYFLLESMSKRVELKMPEDAFRFTSNSMEFIHMESNTVNEEKSNLFSNMLRQKGFCFPPREASGNPTTMKDYDNGYLLLDAKGKFFHMKRIQNTPYVKAISLPHGVEATHVFLTEFRNRQMLGFLTDSQHRLHVIQTNGNIVPTEIPAYNPEQDDLVIFGNKFDWTVKITTPNHTYYYAIRASDYSLLKTYEAPHLKSNLPGLSFTSPYDQYVKPRF